MSEKWYFAYGSNLNIFQMMKRVGEWTTSKRAYLEGYKLVFNVDSSRWGGKAANIRKTGKSDDKVHGVVYRLKEKKIAVMTSYERRRPVHMNVKSEDGSPIRNVVVYKFKGSSPENPPTVYAYTILEGLRQHGYTEDIIKKVQKSFQSKS
jgi:gamma-glutamylcyclotransferase